jgi:hypothetical protein
MLFNHKVLLWFSTRWNIKTHKYKKVQEEVLHKFFEDMHVWI